MPNEDDRKAPMQDLGAKNLDEQAAEQVKGGKIVPADIPIVKLSDKSSP